MLNCVSLPSSCYSPLQRDQFWPLALNISSISPPGHQVLSPSLITGIVVLPLILDNPFFSSLQLDVESFVKPTSRTDLLLWVGGVVAPQVKRVHEWGLVCRQVPFLKAAVKRWRSSCATDRWYSKYIRTTEDMGRFLVLGTLCGIHFFNGVSFRVTAGTWTNARSGQNKTRASKVAYDNWGPAASHPLIFH